MSLTVSHLPLARDKLLHGARLSGQQSPLMGNQLSGPRFGKSGPAGTLRDGSPHLPGPINLSLEKMLPRAQPVLVSYLFHTLFLSS